MKRTNIVGLLAALTMWGPAVASAQKPAQAFEVGPARFFDKAQILDEATLNTQVASDRVIDSRVRPCRRVRVD